MKRPPSARTVGSIVLSLALGPGALAAVAAPATTPTKSPVPGKAAAPAPAPAAAAKEPGDLWEVTTQMSMEGMPMAMPARTQKVCTPRTWTEPPNVAGDKQCDTLDFRNTPTTSTWKVRCPGPPEVTGEGAITRTSPDAYTGTMKMTSADGVMTMKMSGRRLGDCDSGESRRQAAQQQAQAQAMQQQAADAQREGMQKVCAGAADSMSLQQVRQYGSICDETTMKSAYCARLETTPGFTLVCEDKPQSGTSLADAAAYCGQDPEAIRKKVCDEALKNEAMDLLGKCCPEQTQVLAKRECAGRKYSELEGSRYQAFCVNYARASMADAPKDEKKPETTKDKLKKSFKIPWPH